MIKSLVKIGGLSLFVLMIAHCSLDYIDKAQAQVNGMVTQGQYCKYNGEVVSIIIVRNEVATMTRISDGMLLVVPSSKVDC